MVERVVVGQCSFVCGFLSGCFFTCCAPMKFYCINELCSNPGSTKQVDHGLPRHMTKLTVKSPDSDPHSGWKLSPLPASLHLILWKSWNLDFVNEGFLRNQFLNRVHLGSVIGVPEGVKSLMLFMCFFMHVPHKRYPHLMVQIIFLGPTPNPICKLPRQDIVHRLSTKPRFKLMGPLFVIACECQTMVIDIWCLGVLMFLPSISHGNIYVQKLAIVQVAHQLHFCQKTTMSQWIIWVVVSNGNDNVLIPLQQVTKIFGVKFRVKMTGPHTNVDHVDRRLARLLDEHERMGSENNCLAISIGIGNQTKSTLDHHVVLVQIGNTVQHCFTVFPTHGDSLIGLDGNWTMFMHFNIGVRVQNNFMHVGTIWISGHESNWQYITGFGFDDHFILGGFLMTRLSIGGFAFHRFGNRALIG